MARSKIFNMIKNRGTQQNGRNAFDLSGFETYSEKCQTINVLRAIDTIPDDYFNVKVSDFTQCAGPMKTAAFVRGTREIAAYYVPYNSIWHNFNQYQATREDPDSVLLSRQGISYEPRFSLTQLYMASFFMFGEWLFCHYYKRFADLIPDSSNPDWSINNIGSRLVPVFQASFDSVEQNLLNTSIGSIDYGMYSILSVADTVFTDADGVSHKPVIYKNGSSTITRSYVALDTVGNYCWSDAVRKLDMLGYGNIYPIFAAALKWLNDDTLPCVNLPKFYSSLAMIQGGTSAYQDVADLVADFQVTLRQICRNVLFQLKYILNSDSSIKVERLTSSWRDQYVNVYSFFAYNRCFYDMFRNSYFDLDYNITCYNIDHMNCSTLAGSIVRIESIDFRAFKLECHQYKKDMFTGVLPDTQFGAVSSIDLSNVSINTTNLGSLRALTFNTDGSAKLSSTLTAGQSPSSWGQSFTSFNIPSAFNVLALRRAECLQQYRMDLLRAGNKTRDIFKQIYGTNPKSELDEAPYFIDVFGQDLKIDPIIATADTQQGDNGSLGDISARVTSRGDSSFKFSTQDFGVLLIVDYTLIDASYNSTLIDPERTKLTQEDHFIPQLMNLGFEAVYGDSLHQYKDASVRQRVLGYSLPYLSKKTFIDKVHGNFVQTILPSLLQIDSSNDLVCGSTHFPESYVGSNSIWSVTRKDMQLSDTVELKHFYGSPSILDDIFVIQADPTFESDQFVCHTLLKVDSVRQLSELGLPRFC